METHKTNVFYAIVASFFSQDLYLEVVTHWRKKIFLYVLVLLLILLIPVSIRISLNFSHVVDVELKNATSDLPTLSISHGQAVSSPEGTHFITYPGLRQIIGIYDTKGQYKNFPKDNALFLVGQKGSYVKFSQKNIKFYPYQDQSTVVIGPQQVKDMFRHYKHYLWITIAAVLYTAGLMFLYVLYFVYASLLGVFTTFSARLCDRRLVLQKNFRLTLVAMTPSFLIFCVLYLFNWVTLPAIALLILLQLLYVGFAVRSIRSVLSIKDK